MKKTIAGREYDYTQCLRCRVWIQDKDYKDGTHEDCNRYFRTLEIRERATAKVLERLSP